MKKKKPKKVKLPPKILSENGNEYEVQSSNGKSTYTVVMGDEGEVRA
jgi:hypothetical protein